MVLRRIGQPLPKIDKRVADRTLLRDYEDARNERRSRGLQEFLEFLRAGYLLFLVAWVFLVYPKLGGLTALYVIVGVGLMIAAWSLSRMVMWSPHGSRRKMLWIVLGFVAFLLIVTSLVTIVPMFLL